ncbi:MAG: (deoxy)nucleoside triphosphate pyrophosphohydrolase [Clostridia bacterium]|nr:(deoxy)nucleoside triphosphate pyrophosphohydrolase [Clostridia bacterium]
MRSIEVVAAIIIEDGKLFTTQRGYGKFKDGWEFPGGKIEPNETKEAALERELWEELAIKTKAEKLVKTIDYDYPDFHITMHCFLTKIVEGTPKLLEHENAKWVTKNEIDSVDWLPADLEIIDDVKNLL